MQMSKIQTLKDGFCGASISAAIALPKYHQNVRVKLPAQPAISRMTYKTEIAFAVALKQARLIGSAMSATTLLK